MALVVLILIPVLASAQRSIRAVDAWASPAGDDALAYVAIENGTMYDVYLTGAEAEIAQTVELRQTSKGTTSVVKEVLIPAFERLAMASEGTHLKLNGMKRPVKTGDTIPLALTLDNGDRLNVSAVVK